jgi:DNA topoisomerase-1
VYVRLATQVFMPTEFGRRIYESLAKHFASIVEVKFTANMARLLDDIAPGRAQWVQVLSAFCTILDKDLKLAEVNMETQLVEPQVTEDRCEKCGSPMLLRESRFGKFLSCSQFPTCKFKIGLTSAGQKKVLTLTNILCEKCGAPMAERTGRRGKFLACSKFPECRSTKSLPPPAQEGTEGPSSN